MGVLRIILTLADSLFLASVFVTKLHPTRPDLSQPNSTRGLNKPSRPSLAQTLFRDHDQSRIIE